MPKNWSVVPLSLISTKIVDGNHNPPKSIDHETIYMMLSSQNVGDGELINLEKVRFLSKEQFDEEDKRTKITAGDVLFTSVGTIGRSYVYKCNLKICFQRSVSVISTLIEPEYLKIFLDAPRQQYIFKKESSGTAQKGFYLNQLSALPIVIPPKNQQKLIVDKVSLFNQIINEF